MKCEKGHVEEREMRTEPILMPEYFREEAKLRHRLSPGYEFKKTLLRVYSTIDALAVKIAGIDPCKMTEEERHFTAEVFQSLCNIAFEELRIFVEMMGEYEEGIDEAFRMIIEACQDIIGVIDANDIMGYLPARKDPAIMSDHMTEIQGLCHALILLLRAKPGQCRQDRRYC